MKTNLTNILEVLNYCKPHIDQMWAAKIVSTLLECDFRDVKSELEKIKDWLEPVPPRIPMTLEVECLWEETHAGIAFPNSSKISLALEPFIGKRTKMTLVEILENE